MKYLKLFEEKKYDHELYWEHQIDDFLNEPWYNFSIKKSGSVYELKFETEKYYPIVYFEKGLKQDDYYLEEKAKPKFIEKFKKEFFKNPEEYVKNFQYDPKILGNLDMYRETKKFNL